MLEAEEVTSVPIRDDGEVLGVAVITPPPEHHVSEEDGSVLSVVLGNMALLLRRIHYLELERARAEEVLRLKTAIDSLPVLVKLLSPRWIVELVNPAVEEVLGYSPDELVGRHISTVRDAEGANSRQAEIAAALRDGAWTGDVMDRHKDGHLVPVRLVVAPVRDAEGEISGIIEIARDLTHEQEQERRAKDAYRLAVTGRLAAAVAHEVNNPLAAITMMTRVLLDDELPAGLREDLEIINAEAHRAGGISRNLLTFARQGDARMRPVDLEEVVEDVVRLKGPELRLAEIEVEVKSQEDLPWAVGNDGQLRQVVHNLISNAAHAIQEGDDEDDGHGRIWITLTPVEGGRLEVSVEDDGPGIPEAALDQIMTPFFTTKIHGEGTGLGLSVCRDIMDAHGGGIEVENHPSPDRGVRASIRVPSVIPPERVEERGRPPAASRADGATILVVDDDVAVASTLERLVERLGYAVHVEHRGEAALRRLGEGERFDAILVDLNMPGMGGEGVYRTVERDWPHLLDSLVFMSGELAPGTSHEFLRTGSCPTLEKPFTPDQLRAVLEEAMSRGAGRSGA